MSLPQFEWLVQQVEEANARYRPLAAGDGTRKGTTCQGADRGLLVHRGTTVERRRIVPWPSSSADPLVMFAETAERRVAFR